MKTLKELRAQIDRGLITPDEVYGQIVNVGFMTLKVIRYEVIPGGGGLPNKWHLESRKGNHYEFTPYNGIVAVD